MTIAVISTGFRAPAKQRCLDSVARQKCRLPIEHIYIEASEQDPPGHPMANFYGAAIVRPKTDIIAWLDGDDELARNDALDIVAAKYEDPECWLTYGSMRVVDGRNGSSWPCHRTRLPDDCNHRAYECPSHLKTFRAALLHHLDPAREMQYASGAWRDDYRDGVIFIPMLELAGPSRRRFIEDVLVLYHYENSQELRMTPLERQQEICDLIDVWNMPPRERLERL